MKQSDQILELLNINDSVAEQAVKVIVDDTKSMLPPQAATKMDDVYQYYVNNPLSKVVLDALSTFTEEEINNFIEVFNAANVAMDGHAVTIESMLADTAEDYFNYLKDTGVIGKIDSSKQTLH